MWVAPGPRSGGRPVNCPWAVVELLWWWCHATLSGGEIVPTERLGVVVGLQGLGVGWEEGGVAAVDHMAAGLGTGQLSWPSV